MISQRFQEIELLRFAHLHEAPGLVHAVTTKPWNMACHGGPEHEASESRRQKICEHLGVPFERLTRAQQVHADGLAVIRDEHAGAGRRSRDRAIPGVDGLLTDRPDTPLMLQSADCPLVLVYDPTRPALGAAHASWRCTVRRITQKLVERMVEAFGATPSSMLAGIGPSAGPERYEVGNDVRQAATAALDAADRYFRQTAAGMTFDLWAANRDQLMAGGVPEDRIEVAGLCTIGDDRFFSYRREGASTGRFALVAALRSA